MSELKPCPLCGGSMSVRSSFRWHRLVGEHAEDCLLRALLRRHARGPKRSRSRVDFEKVELEDLYQQFKARLMAELLLDRKEPQ